MAVKIKVKVDDSKFKGSLEKLVNDDKAMLACHNLLYKMMTPYVPFDTGTLSQDVQVTSKYVRYNQPYAHYMYEGIVYGPNIPIMENGMVVGFYSRPGMKKSPTGKLINYDKAHHPLATRHWDEAMLRAQRYEFENQVAEIFRWRSKQL